MDMADDREGVPSGQVEPQEWTYIGQRLNRSGKVMYAWLDHAGGERWYGKSLMGGATVGAVYRVHVLVDGRVVTGGSEAPRYVRMSDDGRRATWRADHADTQGRIEAERARRKAVEEHKGDLGAMTLSEAAAWYRSRALPAQRAGALAVLIDYIQHGR